MYIVSVNVGMPALRERNGEQVLTGGDKLPVDAAWLDIEGFAGDGQADRVNHGGADKAVCIYPFDHYAHWEQVLGKALAPGAFSENLTIAGALESVLCIGDVLRMGGALVQVCQPRMPCTKVAGKHHTPELLQWMVDADFTGCYLRVLEPGRISRGDAVDVVEQQPDRISISAVNDIIYGRSVDVAVIAKLAEMPGFSAEGRRHYRKRLEKLQGQAR